MATAKLNGIVAHLGRGSPDTANSITDGELLARFIASRDEPAFAELVRRHGRLVFGVCRRVTGNHHLAEDAFQAAFVVLATKAATIRPPSAVAWWLHGVAYRTALRARTMADRRRRRETAVGTLPEASSPAPRVMQDTPDAVALLDEEIARLPDHYRLPVVLCELEGVGRKDAARRLGINEGTLSSRLAAARKALADRLRQRGIALSAAGLSAALAQAAGANPPPALAAKAAAAASPELISASVAALSHGVLRIMFLDKLKTAVLLAAVALGLATCAAFAAQPGAIPSDPPKPAPVLFIVKGSEPVQAKAEPKALPQGPNKLLVFRAGTLIMIDPDGKNEKKVGEDGKLYHTSGGRLSPDGKWLAIPVLDPLPPDDGTPGAKLATATLHLRGIDEKDPGINLGIACTTGIWSPDGAEIACSSLADGRDGKPHVTNSIVNVKTKAVTELKLPANHVITDWSRDGKYFVTTRPDMNNKDNPKSQIFLMNRDGTEHKALTDKKQIAVFGCLSPDGKKLLFQLLKPAPKGQSIWAKRELAMLDIETGKIANVEEAPLNGDIQGYCWSPDGKRIAYVWREVHDGKPEEIRDKETESFLVVCDPDGKNHKTIASEKGAYPAAVTIGGVDWR